MMTDFKRSTEAQELDIHADNMKIVANQTTNRVKDIENDGMHVEILLLERKVKFLGKLISFMDQENTKVQHRIRCAWSAFARH